MVCSSSVMLICPLISGCKTSTPLLRYQVVGNLPVQKSSSAEGVYQTLPGCLQPLSRFSCVPVDPLPWSVRRFSSNESHQQTASTVQRLLNLTAAVYFIQREE